MLFLFATELFAIMQGTFVLNNYSWYLEKTLIFFLACTFYINPGPVPDFIWTFKYRLSVMVAYPLGPFEFSGRQEYQLKLGCVTEMLTMSALSWLPQLEAFTLSMMLAAAFQKIIFELETLRLCTTAFPSRVLTTWFPYLPPPYPTSP